MKESLPVPRFKHMPNKHHESLFILYSFSSSPQETEEHDVITVRFDETL